MAVVGGGISGLAAAHFLTNEAKGRGHEVALTLFESSNRLGGVIRTFRSGPRILEAGPDSFSSGASALLGLVGELGMERELIGSCDARRRTYLLAEGAVRPLPDGMAFLAPVRLGAFLRSAPLSVLGKLRVLLEPIISPSRGDLSVEEFFRRRLGAEFTSRIAEPLVSSIFSGGISKLSIQSTLPHIFRAEQRGGSLWRGMRPRQNGGGGHGLPTFLSFREGMEQFVNRLAESLEGMDIRLGVRDLRLGVSPAGFRLRGVATDEQFDAVVLCTPASSVARLLESFLPEAADLVSRIPYGSASIVHLAYPEAAVGHALDGFGMVAGSRSGGLQACTWTSRKFEGRCPPGEVLLRCTYRTASAVAGGMTGEELAGRAHEELKPILTLAAEPVFTAVHRIRETIPQLHVGHANRLEKLRELLGRHPGLFVASSFVGGPSIPDCVRTAHETAGQVLDYLRAGAQQSFRGLRYPVGPPAV